MNETHDVFGPPSGPPINELHINAVEAAHILGTSIGTILAWARAGLVPCHVLRHEGRRCWLFKASELREWQSLLALEGGPKGPETVPNSDFESPANDGSSIVSIQ